MLGIGFEAQFEAYGTLEVVGMCTKLGLPIEQASKPVGHMRDTPPKHSVKCAAS